MNESKTYKQGYDWVTGLRFGNDAYFDVWNRALENQQKGWKQDK